MNKKRWIICCVLIAAVILVIAVTGRSKDHTVEKLLPANTSGYYEKTYDDYLKEAGFDGTLTDAVVNVDLSDYTISDGMTAEEGVDGLLTGETGCITWNFQVEKEGFYNLEIGYINLPGTTSDIQRQVTIDGESCYTALEQIVLKRFFMDEAISVKNENEIRPNANEVYKETLLYVEDYNRRSGAPLIFYLSKGSHTITFKVIKEPLEFTSLTFQAATASPVYEEAINSLMAKYPVYDADVIIAQAERDDGATCSIKKSSSSINIQKNYSDSNLEPYHPYHIIYNTIGGDSWKQPGDSITWEITVPKEGLYALTFKGRQCKNRGVTSYRRLSINGEIPYKEMNAVGFTYQADMTNYTIMDEEGSVYYFHLKEGLNTITLESVLGSFGGIVNEVEESMANLNQLYLKVIRLTGQTPDKYIDYDIPEKIPEFEETMLEESERLYTMIDELVALTGEKGENTALLEKMAIEAKGLSEKPEKVVEELTQLKNNISALGTWLVTISSMPLELDSIMLSGDTSVLPPATDTFFASAKNGMIRFFSTFFVSSKEVSAESSDSKGDETIKVWMASSGREQAQIIQNMIDETFTPETNIHVMLQLIPVDVVLRAALAGNGPDVVIGLAQSTMQDFAMRDAVTDLSKLNGFEALTDKYYDSVLEASSYNDGVYGIPEQATFMMLFYRKDILDGIDAKVPSTWDEVKELIPVIKRNNYDFYIPSTQTAPTYTNLYSSIVFQNGGDLYTGESDTYGVQSALNQEAAMISFKEYTDFYTSYGLLVTADFSNRFRTGEMPIGITNYTTYCQLEIFAPEIKGLWSFAPLPGVEKEDGTIDRSYVVDTVQSVIMSGSSKQEAAWEFIKWWDSTKTQLSYATTLESVMGTAARYPAADPNVLSGLPWSNDELAQLLAQFEQTVGIRAVPGHYMTTRMIQYSFNDVVANLSNPRETLYLNVKDINKELTKKRTEFHLSTEE